MHAFVVTGPTRNDGPASAVREEACVERNDCRSSTNLVPVNRKRYRIAAIGGDGIGPEVVEAGLSVLCDAADRDGFALDVAHYPWGSAFFLEHGHMMPEYGLTQLRDHDAIYFGAVGSPEVPDEVTLWGLRLAICQAFDQYANVRPVRSLPGIVSKLHDKRPVDFVIVRENTEGEYSGHGGRVHRGQATELATDTSVFTRAGCERIIRFAFELARTRRKTITIVTKSNALRYGMVLWDDIAADVSSDYGDFAIERVLVDTMAARLVLAPHALDVVVASNLHANILSELAAAIVGSVGLGAAASLDPKRRSPSMFEPVHGSALDLVGTGRANPIGAIWSGAMMLEHLGEHGAARRVLAAIETTTRAGTLTADVGGQATMSEVITAVRAALNKNGVPLPAESASFRLGA